MTRVLRVLLAAAVILGCGTWTGAEPRTDRCVILVSVDGWANSYLDDREADMPCVRRLAREGARAEGMVCVFPTVTWANHAAISTGATAAKHGVIANSYLDRTTGKPVQLLCDPVFDKDQALRVPTIFDAAHRAGLKVATISWPITRNAGTVDWNAPDMGGDGWDRFGTKSWLDELRAEGLPVDRQAKWVTEITGGVMRDWLYTRMAMQVLEKHAPNLILLHLVELDHVAHHHAPRTPESNFCTRFEDDRVRDLVETIGRSKYAGKTTLIVCGDHGFQPVERVIRPNVVLRKLGFLDAEKGKRRAAFCLSQGGGCAVYVFDTARRGEILKQIQKELAPIEGVAAVLDAPAFTKLGQPTGEQCDRGADLWLAAKSGYCFVDASTGDEVVSVQKKTTGTHGHLPDQPDLLAACVISGPGIKPGTNLGKISILDLAPTIAKILGVELPTADGKVLDAVVPK